MKSKRRDEITWLKIPFRKWKINDFETHRQPFRGFKRRGGIESFGGDCSFQAENNLRFYFERTAIRERKRGGVAAAVLYRVFVHVRPNQGFQLEHAPHGLIGIPNLAADCFVSTWFAELLECSFNLISHVEIETGSRRRKDCYCPTCLIRGQQFPSQIFCVTV